MPRKSTASTVVRLVPSSRPRPPPAPAQMNDVARAEWVRIVRAMPTGYFKPEMFGMLGSLCLHAAEERRLTAALDGLSVPSFDGALKFYKDLSRLRDAATARAASLATKLRLSPQARYQSATAARLAEKPGAGESKPWAGGQHLKGVRA